MSGKRRLRQLGFWLSVIVIVSPAILVFLWMLSLSLKTEIDNITYPPVFIPNPPTFANFVSVFEQNSIGRYLWNSIVVSGGATLVALAIGVPAGFGIARAGAHKLTVVILIARMTPALSYLIPLFTVFQFLGLNNTLTALVITHLVITVPIVVYIMAGYFETLPKELEEAALIDGGSVWTTFVYVALPLARPGIVVGTILAFIFSWNNFVFGAVLAGRETRTLPVAVYNVLTFEQLAWGPLAAAAIIVTLPVLLLTILIQKEIVVGLTARRRQGQLTVRLSHRRAATHRASLAATSRDRRASAVLTRSTRAAAPHDEPRAACVSRRTMPARSFARAIASLRQHPRRQGRRQPLRAFALMSRKRGARHGRRLRIDQPRSRRPGVRFRSPAKRWPAIRSRCTRAAKARIRRWPRRAPAPRWRWSAPSAAMRSPRRRSPNWIAGGVDTSAIRTVDGPTGVAVIEVAGSGENTIVVIAGANAHADADDVPPEWLRPSTVVVMQQEVPAAANLAVARRARAAGARVVLNAAPARAVDPALLDLAHVMVVNETEMRALADRRPARRIGTRGICHRVRNAARKHRVVTLGAAGALAAERGTLSCVACSPSGCRRLDRCRRRLRRRAGGRTGTRPAAVAPRWRGPSPPDRWRAPNMARSRHCPTPRASRPSRRARIADDRAALTPATAQRYRPTNAVMTSRIHRCVAARIRTGRPRRRRRR